MRGKGGQGKNRQDQPCGLWEYRRLLMFLTDFLNRQKFRGIDRTHLCIQGRLHNLRYLGKVASTLSHRHQMLDFQPRPSFSLWGSAFMQSDGLGDPDEQ